MTSYVGIDPDSKATGICIASDTGFSCYVVRSAGKLASDRMAGMARALDEFFREHYMIGGDLAVEWQQHRPGREKNPNSIFPVQAVAGMAVVAAGRGAANVYMPVPSDWRGTIEKEVEQRRILAEAGLTLDSPEFAHIPKSMRTHCVDALGLIQWMRRGRRLRGEAARA